MLEAPSICLGSIFEIVLDSAPRFLKYSWGKKYHIVLILLRCTIYIQKCNDIEFYLCMTSSVNKPIKISTSLESEKVSPNFSKTLFKILAVATSPSAKMSVMITFLIFCTSTLINASTNASSVASTSTKRKEEKNIVKYFCWKIQYLIKPKQWVHGFPHKCEFSVSIWQNFGTFQLNFPPSH